jgi:hypothetical protein
VPDKILSFGFCVVEEVSSSFESLLLVVCPHTFPGTLEFCIRLILISFPLFSRFKDGVLIGVGAAAAPTAFPFFCLVEVIDR